jgi:hypothetical protein
MKRRITIISLLFAALAVAANDNYAQSTPVERKARVVFSKNRKNMPTDPGPDCVATTVPKRLRVKQPTNITWTIANDTSSGDPCPAFDKTAVKLDFMGHTSIVPGTAPAGKAKASVPGMAPNGVIKYKVMYMMQLAEDPEVEVDSTCGGCGPK